MPGPSQLGGELTVTSTGLGQARRSPQRPPPGEDPTRWASTYFMISWLLLPEVVKASARVTSTRVIS